MLEREAHISRGASLFAHFSFPPQTTVDLAKKYSIQSYPTLYYFPGTSFDGSVGAAVKYSGANEAGEITKFLDRQMSGFEVTEIDTSESYDSFVGSMNEDLVVILKDKASTASAAAFQKIYPGVISDELLRRKTIYFGRVDVDADFGPKCDSVCLEVWNKKTGIRKTKTGSFTEDSMAKFIVGVGSAMDPYVPALLSKCQTNSIVKLFVMVVAPGDKVQALKDSVVTEITSNHAGEIGATWVDSEKSPVILEHYRLEDESSLPAVLLLDISGGVGTIVTKLLAGSELEGDKLVENLRNCWLDYGPSSGKECGAVPRARSEAAKKGNMKMVPVKKLVGKNLRRNILLAEDKDQFVFFFSKGDKEHMRNNQEFNAFASRYQMEPTIDFFNYDVDDNDVTLKNIDVGSTPVVWLYPGVDKSRPVRFEAEEFLNEHMFEFLWSHVTVPFRGYVTERKYVGTWGRVMYSVRRLKREGFKAWVRGLFRSQPMLTAPGAGAEEL